MALVRLSKHFVSLLSSSRLGRAALRCSLGDDDAASVLLLLGDVVSLLYASGEVELGAGLTAPASAQRNGAVDLAPSPGADGGPLASGAGPAPLPLPPPDAATAARLTMSLAGKLFVLVRAGCIPSRELARLQLPIEASLAALQAALRAAALPVRVEEAVVTRLASALSAVCAAALVLARGHLKARSLAALGSLAALYGSERTVSFLLREPACAEPRGWLLAACVHLGARQAHSGGVGQAGEAVASSVKRRGGGAAAVGDWAPASAAPAAGSYLGSAAAPPRRGGVGRLVDSSASSAPQVHEAGASPSLAASVAAHSAAARQRALHAHSAFPLAEGGEAGAAERLRYQRLLQKPCWAGALEEARGAPDEGVGGAAPHARQPDLLADWCELPLCAAAFARFVADASERWRAGAVGRAVALGGSAGPLLGAAEGAPVEAAPQGAMRPCTTQGEPGGLPAPVAGVTACDSLQLIGGDLSLLPHDPVLLLELRFAVTDYSGVSSRATRSLRGAALFSHFFVRSTVRGDVAHGVGAGAGAGTVAGAEHIPLPPALYDTLRRAVCPGSGAQPIGDPHAFAPALAHTEALLQAAYVGALWAGCVHRREAVAQLRVLVA